MNTTPETIDIGLVRPNINHKARLIVTLDCPNACEYCCNKYDSTKEKVRRISDLRPLVPYKEIIITGGEPMLRPIRTLNIINHLRDTAEKIYLYTSLFRASVYEKIGYQDILRLVDGVQVTIHDHATQFDIANFGILQTILWEYREKSLRLSLSPNIVRMVVPIIPAVWSEVKIKRWKQSHECVVPADEDLFLLNC